MLLIKAISFIYPGYTFSTFFCVFAHRLIEHQCTGTHTCEKYTDYISICVCAAPATADAMKRDLDIHMHISSKKKTCGQTTVEGIDKANITACNGGFMFAHISFSAGSLKITIDTTQHITIQLDLKEGTLHT